MKLKTKLFVALSACALVGGAVAGISAGRMGVIEAKAYSPTTTRIYANVNGVNWMENANIQLVYEDKSGGNETFMRPSETLASGVFAFDVPDDIGTLQLVRSRNSNQGGYSSENGGLNWANGWNYSGKINFDSGKNFIKIKGYDNNCDYYYIHESTLTAGEKLYFTIDNNGYDWFGASATTSVYLWNDLYGTNKTISASRVAGSTTVSATLDADFVATGFKAVRVDPSKSFDGSTWDGVVWNEGNNVIFTEDNEDFRAVISRTVVSYDNYGDGFEEISSTYFAKAFSYYFLEATKDYCGSEINAATLTALKNAFDAYETLQSGTKAAFYGASLNHVGSGWRNDNDTTARLNPVSEALSRYWNMINEVDHGKAAKYDDFLGIASQMSNSGITYGYSVQQSNANTAVIVAVTISATLIAAGSLFLLRKKKEN